MTTIREIAEQVAHTLNIVEDAARDALTTYLHQMEALESRSIDPDDINDDDAAFLAEAVRQAQRAGDLGGRDLQRLEEAAFTVTHSEAALRAALSERDTLIIAAVRAGARVTDITSAAGISRARLQQIKDAHATW